MPKLLENRYVLATRDAAETASFFCETLGFTPCEVADPGWRFVRRDGVMVMIGTCPEALPVRELGDHSYFAYIEIDDVDALHAEFASRGGRFPAPTDKPWGMREFAVRTPDGHGITFGQESR